MNWDEWFHAPSYPKHGLVQLKICDLFLTSLSDILSIADNTLGVTIVTHARKWLEQYSTLDPKVEAEVSRQWGTQQYILFLDTLFFEWKWSADSAADGAEMVRTLTRTNPLWPMIWSNCR